MSSYVVLARKWRSAQFTDIVGQSHIVRTLMNAIEMDRVHQAYLFTGSRGIGKTSIARIFSKVLRCPNSKTEEINSEKWLVSCDNCPSCHEIREGRGVDVIEIDGASNNGVDAIREIRENAKFLPSTGSKKIYIIDEVHMLTTAAFNALLKTLEEPPAHVIFIFATTEPQKIPATILSRCQRFDFKRHTIKQIESHLESVAKADKIKFEAGALSLIAQAAEGSMRDSLSLLDQAIAFSQDNLTVDSVRDSIGLVSSQSILDILENVFSRDAVGAVEVIAKVHESGHDMKTLARGLVEYLHSVILIQAGVTEQSRVIQANATEWERLKKIAGLRSIEEAELMFQVLNIGVESIARAPNPKIVLDILLIKCASAEVLESAHTVSETSSQSTVPAKPEPEQKASSTASAEKKSEILAPEPVKQPESQKKSSPPPKLFEEKPNLKPKLFEEKNPEPKKVVITGETLKAVPSENQSWEDFIAKVRKKRPILASILEFAIEFQLPTQQSAKMTLKFKKENQIKAEQLQSMKYKDEMNRFLQSYFGQTVFLTTEIEASSSAESIAEKRVREHKEKLQIAREAVENHPMIQEARSLFGGQLSEIELSEESTAS